MFDEPLPGSAGLRTASIVMDVDEKGKTALFRVQPITREILEQGSTMPYSIHIEKLSRQKADLGPAGEQQKSHTETIP